jgi:putative ABC transport system permease protein
MAITGIGALASSLMDGLSREGRAILGGDLSYALIHKPADEAELKALAAEGRVSEQASLRAMARAASGDSALIDIKAVDRTYPEIGTLVTDPPLPRDSLFALKDGAYGAVAEATLLARLGLALGARVKVGDIEFELRARLVTEPDKVATNIGFGPRFLISVEGLNRSGLLQPGSLVRWTYAIVVPRGAAASETDLRAAMARIKAATPESGWRIRSRLQASPEVARGVRQFTQFLAVVALTSLVVGGVGVANAVRGYIDRRRTTLAILKSLGATGGRVFSICLVEVMALAALGILVGLVAGALLPFAIDYFFGALLPLPLQPSVHASDLALGAAYGVLTSLVFALWPLGRSHDIPVSALFRDEVAPDRRRPRPRYLAALAAAVVALTGLAIGFAWDRQVAAITVAATAACFVLLRLVAGAIIALAARAPVPAGVEPRLALANLHRPGALTASLVMSLGLGVALLVALTAIDGAVRGELLRGLPKIAPSFFFLDIPNTRTAEFDSYVAANAKGGKLQREPMIRGRFVSIRGVPADQVKVADRYAWVLEGDRGITYSRDVPAGSRVTAGEWWPPDHTGERLVSFDDEIAGALGLRIGDEIVVNVLGRNIAARVANLRKIEWRSLGISFVVVFSPNSFAGAPHTHLATLTFPEGGSDAEELRLVRALGQDWPQVTAVRVKDRLEAFNATLGQLVAAIRGASSVALAASLLVLAGALAAGQRARRYDAVILKTLGATRGRLIYAFVLEYGLIGAIAALFGVVAGGFAAWAIVEFVMRLPFTFQLGDAATIAILAIFITITLGLLGTWRLLGEKAAPYLRHI